MIMEIFIKLTQAVEGSPPIALTASFVWGVLSILLSPCHLASIPLIIGFMSGQSKITFRKAFTMSTLFSAGILITIGLVGVVTGLLGRMMGDIGICGNFFVAAIFILVGLYLLGIIQLPFLNRISQPKFQKQGYLAAFILGLIFGIAIGPCTFAYMAPMLGIVFKVSATHFLYAVSLVAVYAAGHCLVIIIAGSSFELIEKYLKWNEESKMIMVIKKVCGVLVILGGLYLVYGVVKAYL